MTLQLPLPPIPRIDKQKFYKINEMVVGQRFVGIYQGVHLGSGVEHEVQLLDGQIAFVEGCNSLRRETEVLKKGDLVAMVYQGRRTFMAKDATERSAPTFDVFVFDAGAWTPTFVLSKTIRAKVDNN